MFKERLGSGKERSRSLKKCLAKESMFQKSKERLGSGQKVQEVLGRIWLKKECSRTLRKGFDQERTPQKCKEGVKERVFQNSKERFG